MSQYFIAIARALYDFTSRQKSADGELDSAIRHMARSALEARPNPAYTPTVPLRTYNHLLEPALDLAEDFVLADVARATRPVMGALPWHYNYPAHDGDQDLGANIAFAEFAGPMGPLQTAHARLGFTLIGPDTFYPMHAHPAVELYLVVSGHATWQVPGEARVVPPGGFVLHRSGQPHAMQTHSEPLLAVYAWQGDLDAPSVYL
ncbi:dimethlysulfoniopropionate lyase [Dongia mobilis]|uniref:Dimethlysulfoniopropionate lyase n=1 Tax=Dongia mobilis TaxID=578943 RepID=A0A4R6WH32_9PROT|nr:dimethylsulfonioproprionate lyase family protein [Dongia mobilis]TDQ77621.1 dimethlysulfoniopropionate lyase [Dongia mobilis]